MSKTELSLWTMLAFKFSNGWKLEHILWWIRLTYWIHKHWILSGHVLWLCLTSMQFSRKNSITVVWLRSWWTGVEVSLLVVVIENEWLFIFMPVFHPSVSPNYAKNNKLIFINTGGTFLAFIAKYKTVCRGICKICQFSCVKFLFHRNCFLIISRLLWKHLTYIINLLYLVTPKIV